MNLKLKKACILFFTIALAGVQLSARSKANIARNTENSVDFFLEKQKHDGALSKNIDFYPMDQWFFSALMSSHRELILQNTYEPGTRDLYGTPESSYLWYLDIADGAYPEYKDFVPYAQYVVAKCLRTQCGVIKNHALSRDYASKSYAGGFAGAKILLAEEILGSWADKETARLSVQKLYEDAAKEEFPESYIKLAGLETGEQRKKYLDKAMEYKYPDAFYMAAQDILTTGNGIVTDETAAALIETASILLEEAEKLYNAKSAMLLGDFWANKICAKTEYSSVLCEKDSNPFHDLNKAVEYYTNAAMYGEPRGFEALAAIYREGYFETTDKNMASFYYYKYRDALYEETEAKKADMEKMRSHYEDSSNDPDGMTCYELGAYYLTEERSKGSSDSVAWFNKGAAKGSALCNLTLGNYHKGKKASLAFYKKALDAANTYPLYETQAQEALSSIDDIYAQVLQCARFKNDVEYWLATKDRDTPSDNKVEKKEVEKNKELLKAASTTEALAWFKNRASNGGNFEKTWYAWILLEDNIAETKYEMKTANPRPYKEVKNAWPYIEEVLSKDPQYAPAIVCEARCLYDGYGTKKRQKDAKTLFETAAGLGYGEGLGFLAETAGNNSESKEYVTRGCALQDEYSYYLSFSNLIWLEGQTEIQDSLNNAVKYGYIKSYKALIAQRIADVSVTFDDNFENLDPAYNLAVFSETAGIKTAKNQRLYLEKNYGDKMTLSSYAVNEAINSAKRKVSADAENAEALYNLAKAYETAGTIVNSSEEMAAKYYLMSAKLGNTEAMEKTADCYYNGFGFSKNYSQAYAWYNSAASNGSENVYDKLGTMLVNGEGCERNVDKGIGFYRKDISINSNSPVIKIVNCFEGLPESYER